MDGFICIHVINRDLYGYKSTCLNQVYAKELAEAREKAAKRAGVRGSWRPDQTSGGSGGEEEAEEGEGEGEGGYLGDVSQG